MSGGVSTGVTYGGYSPSQYKKDKTYEERGTVNPEWERGGIPSGGQATGVSYNPYQEMLNAQTSARRSAYEGGKSALALQAQSAKEALQRKAADAAQQLWIQRMQSGQALPEQMATAGLKGGATESELARLEAGYGSGISGVQRSQMEGLSDIERQRLEGLTGLEGQYQSGLAIDATQAQQGIIQAQQRAEERAASEQSRIDAENRAYQRLLEQRAYDESRATPKAPARTLQRETERIPQREPTRKADNVAKYAPYLNQFGNETGKMSYIANLYREGYINDNDYLTFRKQVLGY